MEMTQKQIDEFLGSNAPMKDKRQLRREVANGDVTVSAEKKKKPAKKKA